jgi:hypothetical protein
MIPSAVNIPLFLIAMMFAGVSNILAFLILFRMCSLGYRVRLWRTVKDWTLYREYWRVAGHRNWSRAPMILALISFVLAGCFLLAAMHLLFAG